MTLMSQSSINYSLIRRTEKHVQSSFETSQHCFRSLSMQWTMQKIKFVALISCVACWHVTNKYILRYTKCMVLSLMLYNCNVMVFSVPCICNEQPEAAPQESPVSDGLSQAVFKWHFLIWCFASHLLFMTLYQRHCI